MKLISGALAVLLLMVFASCEERSGYLEDDQQTTVELLTDVEWLMTWADYGALGESTFETDTDIYRFERTGKGWFAKGSWIDTEKKDGTGYFQWSFTTANFSVIRMTGYIEGYWLIEKLTPDELWVTSAQQDPVIYPSQDNRRYKFKARK
ncbi:hypothetical protein [uncultured Muribaculum sp.]|uniref:hypothetical protein n=1 Tax=uncultured Muribaculum sp. TaxID=1918613 RepID=UPI002598FDE7|nr:hypothetical protein [uncultured Muribaculum sp.]